MKKVALLILLSLASSAFAVDPMAGYTPSNIRSETELKQAFKKLWIGNRGSECYDRAHFWSHQMSKDFNIDSTKVFVFFTNKYKREIHGQWWFHVAPGVVFQGEDYIMDKEFFKKPVNYKTWINGVLDHALWKLTPIKIAHEKEIKKLYKELTTNPGLTQREQRRVKYINQRITFLENELERLLISDTGMIDLTDENWAYNKPRIKRVVNLECKEITNYTEYENNQESEYCYIIRSSRFYRAPMDLENLDKKGKYIYRLNQTGLLNAFNKAFSGRFPY